LRGYNPGSAHYNPQILNDARIVEYVEGGVGRVG